MGRGINAGHMSENPLSPEIVWLLEEGFFGYIGTSDDKMEPHVTPVTYVYDGRHIYLLTSKSAKKVKNIPKNPKVAFLIDVRDPSNLLNNRAVLIQGTTRKIGILEALLRVRHFMKIRRLFIGKYPKYAKSYTRNKEMIPWRWRTTPFLHRVMLRLAIEKTVYMRECFQAEPR